jgi:hypothetical protein
MLVDKARRLGDNFVAPYSRFVAWNYEYEGVGEQHFGI